MILDYLQWKGGSFQWVPWAWLDQMNDQRVGELLNCPLVKRVRKIL